MKKLILFSMVAVLIAFASQKADAVVIADYQFTVDNNWFSSDTDVYSAANRVSAGSGTRIGDTSWGTPGPGLVCVELDQSTLVDAVNYDDYISFNITPIVGHQVDLNSLQFDLVRRFDYSPSSYALYADETPGTGGDDFTTLIASGNDISVGDSGDFVTYTANLSNTAFLQDITDTTELRLYFYGTTGWPSPAMPDWESVRMDSVLLDGQAEPIKAGDAILANYQFTTFPDAFSSDMDVNSVASDGVVGSGATLRSSSWGTPGGSIVVDSLDSSTLEDAIADEDYVSFSVSPESGYELDLTALQFDMVRRFDYVPDSYALYVDEDPGAGGDNFTTLLASETITAVGNSAGFITYEIDLSDQSFLQGISDTAEFRLYLYGTDGGSLEDWNAIRLDSILLVGQAVEASQIPGDANNDGKVDGSDVTILAGNWQAGVGNPNPDTVTWEMGDFNGDGQVDGSDVTILAGNWQYGVSAAATAVPEPSMTLLVLGVIASLLLWKRAM